MKVAAHMRRRLFELRRGEPRSLLVGQRGGRMRISRAQCSDGVGVHPACLAQAAEQDGTGRLVAHHPGARGAHAQGIVDERGEGGTVLRTSKAMRPAPFGQNIGNGPALGFQLRQDIDRGRQPSARRHDEGLASR